MAAIRHTLQREVFQPSDERLMTILHVTKPGKKKQGGFLCLTISAEPPYQVRLSYVKKSEKGPPLYKKKGDWLLRDLRVVDGINPRKPVPDFELTLDKVYSWQSINFEEKEPFIRQLQKLCDRYVTSQKPEFCNVPLPVDDYETAVASSFSAGDSASQESRERAKRDGHGGGGGHDEEYKPISSKEEGDFRRLLDKCQMTMSDAHNFADHLTKQLSLLDGANLDAILGSESELLDLMGLLDDAIGQADSIETKLDAYDAILANVRETVELMEEKDSLHHTFAGNRKLLESQLESFVKVLDVTEEQKRTLQEGNLSDPPHISRCTNAANAVLNAVKHPAISTELTKMRALQEQESNLTKVIDLFTEKLVAHLSALFNQFSESDEFYTREPGCMPRHTTIHNALHAFSELMTWLRLCRPEGYTVLLKKYIEAFKGVFAQEIKAYFAVLNHEIGPAFDRKPSVSMKRMGSTAELAMLKSAAAAGETGNVVRSLTPADRERFQKTLDKLLAELGPVLNGEQKFITRFFRISSSGIPDNVSTGSNDSGNPVPMASPEKRLEKQLDAEIKSIMGQLFGCVDLELQAFSANADRVNSFYTMFLLGHVWRHVTASQNSTGYLATILGKLVVISKRNFDGFITNQLKALSEAKVPKRMKIGIFWFVEQFELIITEAEKAFEASARRNDVERCYTQLIAGVFEAVERLAHDPNSKAPPSVVLMENYHRIFCLLSTLKIHCLEQARKESKQRYQDNLNLYVMQYMSWPMDKLSGFFNSVDHAIDQGIRAEDVGYQLKFGRTELEKLLRDYPGREVQKGLEGLNAKVAKHLCEEENLFQVVWHKMQEEFINQYKHYESLMAQCYPNASLRMEFTIEDILKYFTDIAQGH